MIVVDAAAVPDRYSGARTRLRGLLAAYARLASAPRLGVVVARGARLLEGVPLGPIAVEETAPPGGPLRRALASRARADGGPLARAARLWHSETIPPRAPRGVPALLTLHDLRWAEPRAATGAPWSKWAARHVAARLWLPRLARSLAGVVTVSEDSARRIVALLRVPAGRVHVVANATAGDMAAPLEGAAAAALLARLGVGDAPLLLAVGHLEPRKGLELVFAALASVPASAQLVLVGAGEGEEALRIAARLHGVAERVVFAGALDDAATATLYGRAAALVFPSRCEGFGFPVHEALAHGCPVVARRLGVLADAFQAAGDPRVTLLDEDRSAWTAALAERLACPIAPRPQFPPTPARDGSWNGPAAALAALYSRLAPRTEGRGTDG